MTQDPGQPLPVNFNVNVPVEQLEGHYADFANIWHNQETFVLDFAAMSQPPQPVFGEVGGQPIAAEINGQVVARVRIPAAQVWEVMKALETQLGAWENENPQRKLG
jgi:hypothetical protein